MVISWWCENDVLGYPLVYRYADMYDWEVIQ